MRRFYRGTEILSGLYLKGHLIPIALQAHFSIFFASYIIWQTILTNIEQFVSNKYLKNQHPDYINKRIFPVFAAKPI